MNFDGRVAIITGGASGIGAATAHLFAGSGASVLIADIDCEKGEQVAADIVASGGQAIFVPTDVSDLGDWEKLSKTAIDKYGRIDVVHNNAFYMVAGPTDELDLASWHRQIDVTLGQVLLSVKTCMAHLKKARGSMINMSSVHRDVYMEPVAGYQAAIGAVCTLTRQLAIEYGPEVRVNAILPGAILTPNWEGLSDDDKQPYVDRCALKRLGEPDDIAKVVRFLASDDASFITGGNIEVDGGLRFTFY
jgi:NAD(P)-dependent dehydrogenase (short-subunit alcohol dehydrogenase family)